MTMPLSALAACCATLACCYVAPAAAQSTWNLGASTCNATPTASFPTTNSAVCTVGTETATMTGWYLNSAGNAYVQGTLGNYDPLGMGLYSGSGESGTDSQHAFDNAASGCGASNAATCGSTQELMLINFGANKVSLSAVALGYIAGDADIAVMRWDGDANGPQSTASLSGSGWNLVATQDVLNTGAKIHNSNNAASTGLDAWQSTVSFGSQVSSWWLVSTYFGTAGTASQGTLSTGDDRFKVLALTANVCTGSVSGGNSGNGGTCSQSGGKPLPEPGSLALTALALLGVIGVRRKLS